VVDGAIFATGAAPAGQISLGGRRPRRAGGKSFKGRFGTSLVKELFGESGFH